MGILSRPTTISSDSPRVMTWYLTMPELASTVGYQGWVRLSGYFGNRVTQRQDVRVLRRGFFSSSGGETGRGVRGVTVVDIEGSVCLRRREDAAAKTLRINVSHLSRHNLEPQGHATRAPFLPRASMRLSAAALALGVFTKWNAGRFPKAGRNRLPFATNPVLLSSNLLANVSSAYSLSTVDEVSWKSH